MSNIYKRWGIEVSSNKKWTRLINRLCLIVGERPYITDNEASLLAFRLGSTTKEVASLVGYPSDYYLYFTSSVKSTTSPFELAEYLESVLSIVASVAKRADMIVEIINNSDCGIKFKKLEKEIISFPSGEKSLDEELVDKPLSFLEGNILIEFKKALKNFSDSKWEECSEKVRRTLEEYLRFKLTTNKGLQAAIPELGKRLKDLPDFPVHLKNTQVTILHALDVNFNEASKHQSKTFGEVECEYLIYQAGLIMRFLDKIEFPDNK